jgi:hypothetical protein
LNIKWILGAALTASLALPAVAQVGIYIGRTPPPLRYERPGISPGPNYAWQEGYWRPEGGRYIWNAGRWNQRPYEGANWNHPHYDHYDRGWQMHEGHWDHEDHGHYDDRGYRH